MPPAAAPAPIPEAELIAAIDATINQPPPKPAAPARSAGADKGHKAPEPSPIRPGDDEEAEPLPEAEGIADAPEDPDDAEEGRASVEEDKAKEPKNQPKDENAKLREQLAEVRGMLLALGQKQGQGKDAPITDPSQGGAATPPGGSDLNEDARELAEIKAAIEKGVGTDDAPGDWKEPVKDLKLDRLVALVEKLQGKETARTQEAKAAKQQAELAQQKQAETFTRQIDTALTGIASSHPEIAPIIGTTKLGAHTENHLKVRQMILVEARHQFARSHERVSAGLATKPMTEAQALTAAVRAITGKEVKTFTGTTGKDTEAGKTEPTAQDRRDAAARARARQVRPESGGSAARGEDKSEATATNNAVADWDRWLKGG